MEKLKTTEKKNEDIHERGFLLFSNKNTPSSFYGVGPKTKYKQKIE
jgi:hypothetical protein